MKTKFTFNPLDPFYTDNEIEVQDTNQTKITLEPWQLEVLKTICNNPRAISVMIQDETLLHLIMRSSDAESIILNSQDALIAIYQNPVVLHKFLKMISSVTPDMLRVLAKVPYALDEILDNKRIFAAMFVDTEFPELETLMNRYDFFIRGLLNKPERLNFILSYSERFRKLVEESPLLKGEMMRLMEDRTIYTNPSEPEKLGPLEFLRITRRDYLEIFKDKISHMDNPTVNCMVIGFVGNQHDTVFIGDYKTYCYEKEDETAQELMKTFDLFNLEIPYGVEDFSILMMVTGIGVDEDL